MTEIIHGYTVHQAINDGEKVLVDTLMAETDSPDMRREAGIVWPVVLSKQVAMIVSGEWNDQVHGRQDPDAVANLDREGQSLTGRMWDLLFVARQTAIAKMVKDNDTFGSTTVAFAMRIPTNGEEKFQTETRDVTLFVSVDYWNAEHGCFSIYLPEEY